MFTIAAFYHFFDFADFSGWKQPLKARMDELGLKGSLLLAAEGFNGTLSGEGAALAAFLDYLKTDVAKGTFEYKTSRHDRQPFKRAKVRLKKETISLGESAPALKGLYVEPKDWNALIADPNVVLLDARNAYEVHLGSFAGAIDPRTKNFKQLPQFVRHTLGNAKDKKIATFCTGGIRCEKLGPWLLAEGFKEVYQLRGGILKYLEAIPESESRWQGECYVFDERIAVGHGLKPSQSASMCKTCGHALTEADRMSERYVRDISCPWCA